VIHPVRWATTKGALGQLSEHRRGDLHGRRQRRECESTNTNGAAGRHTQLEGLTNTNTRGARQLESRLDLHARGTKGEGRASIGGYICSGNFGCELIPCRRSTDWIHRRAASPHAARCARAVTALADLTPQYDLLHLHCITTHNAQRAARSAASCQLPVAASCY
jgi:hypothetical protein